MEEIEVKFKLYTIKKVQDFIEVVSKYDEEITVKSHRYEVDAKSIMALFSLNLLESINVCLYSNIKSVQNNFINDMKYFI